jgi:hypothetical protein
MLSAGNKPLGVTLLGVNDRDGAILELFLDQHWSSNCLLVSEEFADLCILDLDSLGGKKLLQQQQDNNPDRPLIVLSVRDVTIDDVHLLRKPLSGQLLKSAIDDCISVLDLRVPEEEPPTSTPVVESIVRPIRQTTPKPRSEARREVDTALAVLKNNDRRNALPNSSTQARIIRGSCGHMDRFEVNISPGSNTVYYDPNTLLQQELKSAIDQCRQEARPLRMSLPDDKYIALLPESNIALTNLSDSKLRPRCLLPINKYQFQIDFPDGHETDRLYTRTEAPQDIDGLLWKVTLWSARGRLPLGIHIDTTIGLRQWPNLTRLLTIPQFLRIAALWVKTPQSLSKTADMLNIEARYVCAFFSACYALELTQSLSSTEDGGALENDQKSSAAPKGLLRRILLRLRVA